MGNGNWITEKSPAEIRDEALQAKYGKAYKRYSKITASELAARMDRPPLDQKGKKIRGWRSIYGEEARIEACILRYSRCWPICNWYAVLTVGVLGLTFEQATKKGLRLGNDEGYDTFVLDESGDPKPLTQAWISRLLGVRSPNVNHRCRNMRAKKVLHIDGKKLSMVPDPQELTADERQKVIQTDNFLDLPEDLRDAINGFKPPRPILELIARIPEKVIRLDYFSKFSAIQTEYENERKVLQEKKEKGWEVLQAEISILIDKDVQPSQGETLEATAAFVDIPEEPEPIEETPPPPPPLPDPPIEHNGNGTAAAAAGREPETALDPVQVQVFAEHVQAKFLKNPPTIGQCGRGFAKLRDLKLSTDLFVQYLTAERMRKITHGGALEELINGYEATITAESVREEERHQRKDVGCPSCGGLSTTDGRCSFCGKPRRGG